MIYIDGYAVRTEGGTKRFFYNIINHLAEYDDFKKNSLILLDSKKYKEEVKNFHTAVIPPSSNVLKILREEIFLPVYLSNKQGIYWAAKNYTPAIKLKTIMTLHGLLPMMDLPGYFFDTYFWKKALYHSILRADKIVCISKTLADDLIKLFPSVKSNIEIIYHGVENIFYPITEDEKMSIKQNLKLPEKFFICIANEQPIKNLKNIIEAFKTISEYKLVICGKIHKKIIHPNIIYKEPVVFTETKHLAEYYQAADAFISASSYEGFGLPVLEAMACGLPLCISDIPVFKEITDNNAVFFGPHNKAQIYNSILKIIKNKNLQQNLRAKSIEQAKKFSWKKSAQQYYSLFKNLE